MQGNDSGSGNGIAADPHGGIHPPHSTRCTAAFFGYSVPVMRIDSPGCSDPVMGRDMHFSGASDPIMWIAPFVGVLYSDHQD